MRGKLFNAWRFASMDSLRRFDPVLLCEFLQRFPKSLGRHGIVLPDEPSQFNLPYDLIAHLCRDTGPEAEEPFLLGLHFINALSTPMGRGKLRQELLFRGIALGGESRMSPEDYALAAWLKDPDLLEMAQARLTLGLKRVFHYFLPWKGAAKGEAASSEDARERLRERLEFWYFQKQGSLGQGAPALRAPSPAVGARGEGQEALVKVLFYQQPGETWFLIRRGGVLSRLGWFNRRGRHRSGLIRPEEYDAVVYTPQNGMIRVSAAKGSVDAYRVYMGEALFGDVHHFGRGQVFDLGLIKERAAEILSGGLGVERVQLTELGFTLNPTDEVTIIKKGNDLLEWHNEQNPLIPREAGRVLYAKLKLIYRGEKRSRVVRVEHGRKVYFSQDTRAQSLEGWLKGKQLMEEGEK